MLAIKHQDDIIFISQIHAHNQTNYSAVWAITPVSSNEQTNKVPDISVFDSRIFL